MKAKLLTLASVLALSFAANASVTYDEEGVGFVGKGDVQSLFGWNNHELQANAEFVQFRMVMPGGVATWECVDVNPGGRVFPARSEGPVALAMDADVSVDARKNRNGQVTGFLLNGFDQSSAPDYASIGECVPRGPGWESTMVPGSLSYEGDDEGAEMMLQVTVDGEAWYDMPITE